MRTPAGTECPYYYEDFFRGRTTQECRLIERNPRSEPWAPRLCARCPVPAILRANACPNLVLEGAVAKRLFGLRRQVIVEAVCKKHLVRVAEPHVGCGHCHEERAGVDLLGF